MNGIPALIGLVLGLIDKAVPDKAEAERLKSTLAGAMLANAGEFERLKAEIIATEARSESWITRNWRPIAMLNFLVLVNLAWWGVAPEYFSANPDLLSDLFSMVTIGITGYGVGRSGEKIADRIGDALRK